MIDEPSTSNSSCIEIIEITLSDFGETDVNIFSEDTDVDDPETEVDRNNKSINTDSAKNSHECKICNKVYSKKSSLNTHLQRHANIKSFICEVCHKTFSRANTLKVHLLIHSGERSFLCEICDKRFRRNSDLQKHLLVHTGELPYVCDKCGKKFNHISNLHKHKITHTEERPHVCGVCRQAFYTKDALLNHLKKHYVEKYVCDPDRETAIRNYLKTVIEKNFRSCDQCDKLFLRSDQLKRHKLTHSCNWDLNRVCEICNGKFKSTEFQDHLLNHLMLTSDVDDFNNTNEINTEAIVDLEPSLQKPKSKYSCSICLNTFTRKSSLENHSIMHSGVKAHECTLCKKSFSQKSSLKRHMLFHTGERRFACEICNKCYTRKIALRKHYITHSKSQLF